MYTATFPVKIREIFAMSIVVVQQNRIGKEESKIRYTLEFLTS